MITGAALIERAALAAGRFRVLPPMAPTPLLDTYFALMGARAIMAGARLGVFDALAEEPADAAGVAARTSLTAEGADALLGALSALGSVRSRGGRWRNTRVSERQLLADDGALPASCALRLRRLGSLVGDRAGVARRTPSRPARPRAGRSVLGALHDGDGRARAALRPARRARDPGPPPAPAARHRRRPPRRALRSGGTIAILELEHPPAGRVGTQAAGLLGVLFHALSAGRTYTADEVSDWLRESGFERVRVRRRPWLPGAMLLIARG